MIALKMKPLRESIHEYESNRECQPLAAIAEGLINLLEELRDYTARLEVASGAWFATRSYAKHPHGTENLRELRERLDLILGPWEGKERDNRHRQSP